MLVEDVLLKELKGKYVENLRFHEFGPIDKVVFVDDWDEERYELWSQADHVNLYIGDWFNVRDPYREDGE